MHQEKISLSNNDKLSLISNFSTMFSAGIPILETVESLLEDAKGNQKKILTILHDDLMQGKHVYESFSRFPNIFDKVTVNIIKAAEEAGSLDATLKDLKINIKKEMEFSDKIRGALIYPLVIFCVFAGVMLLILTYVVPQISKVFLQMRVTLPLPTIIMIETSEFILTYTIHSIVIVILASIGIYYLFKTQKRALINLLTSLPIVRTLATNIDLTRFSRSLYLLLYAGIPITTALDLTKNTVIKNEISEAINHTLETVVAGSKFSQGLKDRKKVIPTIVIKMVEAGERSGSLDKSMQEVADYLDYQVSKNLESTTRLIEPIMLVLVGVMIGGMMLAIIAPIYGLISQVGGR
jgi:type IV pilus assembly protein PilC